MTVSAVGTGRENGREDQQGVRCTKNVRQVYKKCTLACQFATSLVLTVTWHGICFEENSDGIRRTSMTTIPFKSKENTRRTACTGIR